MANKEIRETRENPYTFHPLLVLRTPRLPIGEANGLQEETSSQNSFLESVYLASPIVYNEILKRRTEKIEQTLYKYYLRSSNRCTPFGIFAGCSVVPWGEKSQKILVEPNQMKRFATLDMDCLFKISNKLMEIKAVRENLLFYPNNSIYRIGDEMRYVENSLKDGHRQYQISSVEYNEDLHQILVAAKNGKRLCELVGLLSAEYSFEEATEYINQLIDAQILINSLKPQLTGRDYLELLIGTLDMEIFLKDAEVATILESLKQIYKLLEAIKEPKESHIENYLSISEILQGIGFNAETNILQVDALNHIQKGVLGIEFKKPLSDTLTVLNKLSHNPKNIGLEQFCKDFNMRYGDTAMPLLHVLDPETGIGYLSGNDIYPVPLVEGLTKQEDIKTITVGFSEVQKLLHRKLVSGQINNCIEIFDEDIESIDRDWEDMPLSCSIIFKVLDEKTNKIQVESVGGSSASNLLGRFGHLTQQIEEIVMDVANWEEREEPDSIIAEIVYQPEDRVCNIMRRPSSRSFEIPYLAQSSLSKDFQLDVKDLVVSVRNNHIILFSQKHQREVLPRLGNAHNFKKNDLPIYRFLCDLQLQGLRTNLRFDWGELHKLYSKLPRVVYKNIILSPALWTFTKNELTNLLSKADDSETKIRDFRILHGVPDCVLFSEGDNELPIDFTKKMACEIFINAIKGKKNIVLTEHIKAENSPVSDLLGNSYANEFIATINKKAVRKKNKIITNNGTGDLVTRNFIFGSEWAYYKFYCGIMSADKILTDMVKPLAEELMSCGLIDKWFFIRYYDPELHIRLRFHLTDTSKLGNLVQYINTKLEGYINSGHIWNQQIDVYSRELERYGPKNIVLTETIFFLDSKSVVQMLEKAKNENENFRWMYLLSSIDDILNCFDFDIERKKNLFYSLRESFAREHKVDKDFNFRLDTSYRKNKKMVWEALDGFALKEIAVDNCYSLDYKMSSTIMENLGWDAEKIDDYLKSIIHMMANRAIVKDHRLHELVIYHFLFNYYNSKIIILRKKNDLVGQ